jgi:acyl carrier protein
MSDAGTPTPAEVERVVAEVVARSLDLDAAGLDLDASLEQQYGAQSIDVLEIVICLERAFRVRMPKTNLIQHAQARFGEGRFSRNGELTDLGLAVLRHMRPEIDPEEFRKGLLIDDASRLVTTRTFVRLVLRLLEGRAEALRALQEGGCGRCASADLRLVPDAPAFVCGGCGATYPSPPGDEILLQDLAAIRVDDVA